MWCVSQLSLSLKCPQVWSQRSQLNQQLTYDESMRSDVYVTGNVNV